MMACGGGQVPVPCSLCEDTKKIQWKCLNCDMLMCKQCKEKIHVKFKFAKDHKVVSIQEIGLHDKEIDFSSISCKNHLKQFSFMFCKSCDCLVCPLCISETHNGHGLVDIREGYEIHINKLKTAGKNIAIDLHELEIKKAEVQEVDRVEHSKFELTMKKIKDQNVLLKKEVDQHTKTLQTELMKKWEDVHLCIEKEEKEVSLHIGNLVSKKLEVDDIIQSNDGKRVLVDGLGLGKSTGESLTSPCTNFDSIPTFLPGQITAYNIGSLEKVSTKSEIKIIKQFDTEIPNVHFMAACSEDTLWLSDESKLQRVKKEGRNLKIIDHKDINIYDMACTPSKDLLLVAGGSVLKQISGKTGEMDGSKYEVKDSVLSAVHVNPDGKVTVGAFFGEVVYPAQGRRVVVVMDFSGKHETTYENDKQGKPIFTYVEKITRTKSGNICVVDKLYKDWRGRLVILSDDGDVLNTFNGQTSVKTDEMDDSNSYSFKPIDAFTTPADNIVVLTLNNDILFILNSSGNLITQCDTNKVGIFKPYCFCTAESGHIYIGCTRNAGSSDWAKIYEVDTL